jgi:2-polyprenyl-6-methoxyphenol hydroxylase-like FAD-dependent oxidoreductase
MTSTESTVADPGEQADQSIPAYDVITVGGGLAASALAVPLATSGLRVLVLEAATSFRDRVRGEWLAPWGVAEARLLRLEDAFTAAGGHRLPDLAGRSGKPRTFETPEGVHSVTFYHPRLQQTLIDTARAAGAEVITGARVREVSGGQPARLEAEIDGAARRLDARLIVGAEGRNSVVRRAMDRELETFEVERLLSGVRLAGVGGDERVGHFILDEDGPGVAAVFPQGGGYARAYVFRNGAEAARYRGDAGLARFLEDLIDSGVPPEVLADAEAAGPLGAFSAEDSWVIGPAGNGLALVGDAAGISDPTWGMGMALAFRDARVLSEGLIGSDDWTATLASYAAERDRYFEVIRTAEHWQTELFLTPGLAAEERRKRVVRSWVADPSRTFDLHGLGPEVDTSAEARARFFGEDDPIGVPA